MTEVVVGAIAVAADEVVHGDAEVEADAMEVDRKCIAQHAQSVIIHVKFLLNQMDESQFTAATVLSEMEATHEEATEEAIDEALIDHAEMTDHDETIDHEDSDQRQHQEVRR